MENRPRNRAPKNSPTPCASSASDAQRMRDGNQAHQLAQPPPANLIQRPTARSPSQAGKTPRNRATRKQPTLDKAPGQAGPTTPRDKTQQAPNKKPRRRPAPSPTQR